MSGNNLFVTANAEGELSLTVPGYFLVAIVIFAALILIAGIANKGKKIGAKQLAFSAAAIALAMITSLIKILPLPFGGYITLFSMFFICLVGYWYGPVAGIAAGIAFGMIQFLLDPYILSLPQVLVDYVFAFGALGLSGFFSEKKHGLIVGYLVGIFGRFFFAVLSGVIFFGQYAPAGMNPFLYSCAYNGTYIGAEGLITLLILMIPAVSNGLKTIKKQAVA